MTPSEFKEQLPEFVDVPDTRVQVLLTRSLKYLNATLWADLYSDGQMYWVAHYLVTSPAAGDAPFAEAAGITVEMVGSVRVERATAVAEKEADDPMYGSRYGREFIRLRTLVGISCGAAVAP